MRRLALLSGLITVVADGVFIYLQWQQGSGDGTLRAVFVAAFIAVCAAAALASAFVPLKSARLVLLSFSSVGLLIIGFLALFSIGLLLWIAAAPAVIASLRLLISPVPRFLALIAGGGIALLVLVAGVWATRFPVSCPPAGSSSGSGVGFLTGDYHWSCTNGTLTTGSGL